MELHPVDGKKTRYFAIGQTGQRTLTVNWLAVSADNGRVRESMLAWLREQVVRIVSATARIGNLPDVNRLFFRTQDNAVGARSCVSAFAQSQE